MLLVKRDPARRQGMVRSKLRNTAFVYADDESCFFFVLTIALARVRGKVLN